MLLLCFETSAKACSAALHDGERLLGEAYQNTGLTHSQTLMVMAEDLLKQCGKTAADVTALAVAAGPGSFTGVRIGVSAAKGFAWGADLPCYGVSTLEAMARSLGVYQGYALGVMDARRAQVYAGLFRVNCGKYTRVMEDSAISLEDLRKVLQKARCLYRKEHKCMGRWSGIFRSKAKSDTKELIEFRSKIISSGFSIQR